MVPKNDGYDDMAVNINLVYFVLNTNETMN